MLLFVVLAGAENSMTLENCIPAPQARVNLPPAERAGIVGLSPRSGRMEFRHPLIRAAVFELSTSDERHRAHALLAKAFDTDPRRRVWHLGQSADTPDEDVAMLLEAVSGQLLESGNSTRATAALVRAAELTPAPEDRARRIARAAYLGSLVTGDLHGSTRLLLEAQLASSDAPTLATVTAAAHQLLNGEGDASSAQRLLITALDATEGPLDPADVPAMEALQTLVFVDFYAGRADFWADTRAQLAKVVAPLPDTLAVFNSVLADPARAEPDAVLELNRAIDGLRFTSDPVRITRIAAAGAHLDRIRFAREPLTRVVADGRRGGAVAKEIEALFLLANDDYFAGEWDDLEAATDEGLTLCDELGYLLTAAPGRYLRALVDSARGRSAAADRAAEQLLLWAAPRRLYTLAAYASHIRCMEALGKEQFELGVPACCLGQSRWNPATVPAPGGVAGVRPRRGSLAVRSRGGGQRARACCAGVRARRALTATGTADRGGRSSHRHRELARTVRPSPRHTGERAVGVRPGSGESRLRRAAQARARPRRGVHPVDVGDHRVPAAPGDSLAGTGRSRTPRGGRRRTGVSRAHATGSSRRRSRRHRADQQADRNTALPVAADRLDPPIPRVHQARHHLARRVAGCDRPRQVRPASLTYVVRRMPGRGTLDTFARAHPRAREQTMSPTIVLVHGGFVDGSGWRGVYDVLRADGFDVRVVQNPTKSLADGRCDSPRCARLDR